MDTPHNRNNEDSPTSAGSPVRAEAHTVSFLEEDQPWNIARIRKYAVSPEGKKVGLAAGIALAAVLVLFVAAAMSLPGQPLYGVKTNVVEGAGGLFRWTTESRAAYHLDLMEERLHELQKLREKESISEGAVAAASQRITKNSDDFVALTQGSEERTMDRRAVMNLTSDFASVSEAMEDLTEDHEPLFPLVETVRDTRQDALRRLRDEIEVYVSLASDDDLRAFLTSELGKVGEEVDRGDLTEDTTNRISRSLGDVADAIAANEATEALEGVFEAHRLIAREKYAEEGQQ